jgi:hypothetical protein
MSTHAVKFSLRNFFKAFGASPLNEVLPEIGERGFKNEVIVQGKSRIVDHIASDTNPGDKVVVFTQGNRPLKD